MLKSEKFFGRHPARGDTKFVASADAYLFVPATVMQLSVAMTNTGRGQQALCLSSLMRNQP